MFVKAERSTFDTVLVGGGLSSALIALALLDRRPETRIAIVESSQNIGGNHLWCFHANDVGSGAARYVEPLVGTRWAGYDTHFPGLDRTFDSPYASVSSERLDAVVRCAFAGSTSSRILFGARAASVTADSVILEDGRRLSAPLVIDARGPANGSFRGQVGYQKFVGLELSLREPTTRTRPLLMDARVEQLDGLRFVYVLPLDPHRVLVEDTYFSDDPSLDDDAIRQRVLAYAVGAGLSIDRIQREERGILPLPLEMEIDGRGTGPLVLGYAGGFFHPTTGYSFPVAVRVAQHIADTLGTDQVRGARWSDLVAEHQRQLGFALLLNRLLFRATPPEHRWAVMKRFHRLPEATVRRFYALETTLVDRARILLGRPPGGVNLRKAMKEMVSP